ncbi:LOW QUALITY PROTEIN: coiled-coil domain-containing protein 13-like [Cariama cristata]
MLEATATSTPALPLVTARKVSRQQGMHPVVEEKLSGERDALKKSHKEVKEKLAALKARNKVLCSEVKSLKGHIVTLLEKGEHDDEFIDALLSQQKQMQEILNHTSQQDEKNKESQQMLGQCLNSEVQKQNCLIEQLRQTVVEREARVKELEEEIAQLTLQQKSAHQVDGSGAAATPLSELSEDPGFTLLKPLASGSNHLRRTGSARRMSKMGHVLVVLATTTPSLLRNNITPERLAGTDCLDLNVLQTQLTEYKALCRAAEVERDRLRELVTVLQEREEEDSNKILETEKMLQKERRRGVILEQQLEKLQMEPGRSIRAQKPALRSKTGESASHSRLTLTVSDRKELSAAQLSKLPLESQIAEVSTRLVIHVDENEALKAALESTVRKKEEVYLDTTDQVKDVFLHAIRQQKQEKSLW